MSDIILEKLKKSGGNNIMKICNIILSLTFLLASSIGFAAKPAKPLRVVQKQGAFFGGQAGQGFSLLSVRSQVPKSKKANVERLFFSVGDLQMKPKKGLPGYYHVEMRGQQIIMDFPQMPQSKVNVAQLQTVLKNSRFISKANMTMDSSDGSMNIVLNLKKPAKLNVLQVPGQKMSSQVVLQLIE